MVASMNLEKKMMSTPWSVMKNPPVREGSYLSDELR